MKRSITFIILAIITLSCSERRKQQRDYKTTVDYMKYAYIGKEISIIKDTLMVMEYDSWNGTYTLSDGTSCAPLIVYENIIDKEVNKKVDSAANYYNSKYVK